jgi:hypothetical protein
MESATKNQGPGGTPGGFGEFFLGLALAIAGGYWILNQVQVTGGSWSIYGYNAFGLSLLPFLIGVGLLFYDGKSIAGWLLLGAGVVILFAGILGNLSIYWQSTSLFSALAMWVCLFGGLGLIAKALKNHS